MRRRASHSIAAAVPLTAILVLIPGLVVAGDTALPGNHPLTQRQAGEVLINELRCAACHKGVATGDIPERTAPDLTQAGTRISHDFLRRYLASPTTVHPGTSMPDVLASRPESQRDEIADALTHFLVAAAQASAIAPEVADGALTADAALDGKALFHSTGCVACHGSRERTQSVETNNKSPEETSDGDDNEDESDTESEPTFTPIEVPIGHVAAKYTTRSLQQFLFQPLKVRASGRMPDMKLTPAESLAIAGYLTEDSKPGVDPIVPNSALVEKGRILFRELNCASCHAMPGFEAAPLIVASRSISVDTGCLSQAAGRGPRYSLTKYQVDAIVASWPERQAGVSEPGAVSDSVTLAKTLTALRCIACHVRDDYGGVHESHNEFFVGSELKLGDDGRIPPPLTLMGAKLQPAWMKRVLFDGESVRHYMSTRMPQFGTASLRNLPELFGRLDQLEGPDMRIPNPESGTDEEREKEKRIRAAGRELLGDKGANCVSCHTFNGKAAQLNQGIDLLTSYQRLQPAWFSAYLRNPGAFRPRTVMPTAWPNGRSVFTAVLDGDTDQQIEAIWYYLSLGTSAADPSGVRGISTKMEVANAAVLHRGRSRVAGFRGIAVGLPERISYAFNAETGTLSAVWLGDFIHVNWSGQGSGDFNPASEPIVLAQDVSFVRLADANDPWPLMPVMTKEARVNSNPLYPKNVGYQFRGYFLDDEQIPAFMYRSGSVEIQDRSVADQGADVLRLHRIIRMESPEPQPLWFRALTGVIEKESDGVFRTDRLRLTVQGAESKLRAISGSPEQSELLLHLVLPAGPATLELFYEPITK